MKLPPHLKERLPVGSYFGPGVQKYLEENLPVPLKNVYPKGPVMTIEAAKKIVTAVNRSHGITV